MFLVRFQFISLNFIFTRNEKPYLYAYSTAFQGDIITLQEQQKYFIFLLCKIYWGLEQFFVCVCAINVSTSSINKWHYTFTPACDSMRVSAHCLRSAVGKPMQQVGTGRRAPLSFAWHFNKFNAYVLYRALANTNLAQRLCGG